MKGSTITSRSTQLEHDEYRFWRLQSGHVAVGIEVEPTSSALDRRFFEGHGDDSELTVLFSLMLFAHISLVDW